MCDIGILQDAGPGDDESRHYEADVSKVRNVAKTQKISEGTIGNILVFLHEIYCQNRSEWFSSRSIRWKNERLTIVIA